jgi:hypothetical protein
MGRWVVRREEIVMRCFSVVSMVVVAAVMMASIGPAAAKPGNGITQQVAALEQRVSELETTLGQAQALVDALTAELAAETAARQAADSALQTGLDAESVARIAADGVLAVEIAALDAAAAFAMALDPYVNVDLNTINGLVGPHVIIEGANVHVRSGSGATDGEINGLGNLLVGYDENNPVYPDDRSGSHNLVVGQLHTYSSYGGFVAGQDNAVTGVVSSVSGGRVNDASGDWSSVSGGQSNHADGAASSVSGGGDNVAIGDRSSVSGGVSNDASGFASSVSGGEDNVAIGDRSSVSGGSSRTAPNQSNWAAGSLLEPN